MADMWLIAVAAATVVYAVGAWFVVRHHREPGLTVVLIMLPMWTTFAAFSIVASKRPGGSGTSSYLEERLFPLGLDGQYATTLSMYFVFLLLFLLFVASLPVATPEARQRQNDDIARLVKAFPFGWAVAGLAVGIAVQNYIANSIKGELELKSLYAASYNELISSGTLRLLTYVNLASSALLAVVAAALVVALTLRVHGSRYRTIGVLLLIIAVLQYQINLTLGDRGTTLMLVLATIAGAARFGNWQALRNSALGTRIGLIVLAAMALYTVPLIGMLRTVSSSGKGLRGSILSVATQPGKVIEDTLGGPDLAAAHFSLYGVIGAGRSALGTTVYPVLTNTYQSYQQLLNLPTGQGFTIHQVASWYLSVGALAPLFAALYGALVIALYLWIGRREITRWSAPWVFTAHSWALVAFPTAYARSGPEALRGTLTAGLLLPTLAGFLFWWIAWNRAAATEAQQNGGRVRGRPHRTQPARRRKSVSQVAAPSPRFDHPASPVGTEGELSPMEPPSGPPVYLGAYGAPPRQGG